MNFKNLFAITVLAILLFLGLTAASYKNQLLVDGNLTYGFPLTIREILSGDVPVTSTQHPEHFSYANLFVDVLFTIAVATIAVYLFQKRKRKSD